MILWDSREAPTTYNSIAPNCLTYIISVILSFIVIQHSYCITDEQYQEISFLIEQNNIEKSLSFRQRIDTQIIGNLVPKFEFN